MSKNPPRSSLCCEAPCSKVVWVFLTSQLAALTILGDGSLSRQLLPCLSTSSGVGLWIRPLDKWTSSPFFDLLVCLLHNSHTALYQRAEAYMRELLSLCVLCVLSHFSWIRLFAAPWTVAHQAPLFMEFSRQEYWSG